MSQGLKNNNEKYGLTRRDFLKVSSMSALALTLPKSKDIFQAAKANAAKEDDDVKVVRTVCAPNCTGSCAINAYVKGNTIIKVEPGDFPNPAYKRICYKRDFQCHARELTHPDRMKIPHETRGKTRGK